MKESSLQIRCAQIADVPYCTFYKKPYHAEPKCFKKNSKLGGHGTHDKGRRTGSASSNSSRYKSPKTQYTPDEEDDEASGLKNPKEPTITAMRAAGEDADAAFGKDVEGNMATFAHMFAMMATRTLPIRDAWIGDSGIYMHEKYHRPPLRSVDASTSPSGVGAVNILCNLFKCGAKVELSSEDAITRGKSNRRRVYTASQYRGVYALDLWTNLSFPAYHVSPQVTLWHHRLAHLSDANLRRLKKQAYGIGDTEPRQPCSPCLQGRMAKKPRNHPGRKGEYPTELLHIDVAGPFDEGLDGSRYWLTIVHDFTG
ncbi:hypothetical protein GQ44DRAFT_732082 [Phaeosphaeriaceae sp. PMI808]|nr:hypothetical protein GQ44DRAFT_732082 [Phaeosphaeriaceae sp. PMI808]